MAVSAVLLVSAAAAHPATGRAAGPSRPAIGATDSPDTVTYSDSTGDSGAAADIASVVLSRDAEHRITFRVNAAKPAVPADGRLAIGIDSDQNAMTGYGGFDYMFVVDLENGDVVGARWDGSDFASSRVSTATASVDSTGVSFSVNADQLGATRAFCFFVRTLAGDRATTGHYDDAPDYGVWSYRLDGAPSLTLTAGDPIATKARAGRRFVALITVARSDGEQAEVTSGEIWCSATAAGRPLQATAIPTYGPAAGCSWRLPKRSRGSTLHAAVTVRLDEASTTQTFTATIR